MVWACFLCTFKADDIQHLKEHTDTTHINFSQQLTAVFRPDEPSTTNEAENVTENAIKDIAYYTIKYNTVQPETATPQLSNTTKDTIIKQFAKKTRSTQLQNFNFIGLQ